MKNKLAFFPLHMAIALLLLFSKMAYSENLSGIWQTKLSSEFESMLITLQLDRSSDYFTIKKPDMTFSVGFQEISKKGGMLTFKSDVGFSFNGKQNVDNTITGTMTYQGSTFPVTFEKKANKAVDMFADDKHFSDNTYTNNSFTNVEGANELPRQTNNSTLSVFIIWLIFWLVICSLLRLKFKRKTNEPDKNHINNVDTKKPERLIEILPLVRFGRRFYERKKGFLVTENSIVFFRKRKNVNIPELHSPHTIQEIIKNKNVRKVINIPDDSILHIDIEQTNKKGWSSIVVFTEKQKHKLSLQHYELPNLLSVLRTRFAGRLNESVPISFKSWGLLIVMSLVSLLLGLFIDYGIEGSLSTSELSSVPEALFHILVVVGVFLAMFAIPIVATIIEYLPIRREPTVKPKASVDLSKRQPYRSKLGSITLKVFVLTSFIIFLFPSLFMIGEYSFSSYELTTTAKSLLQSFSNIPSFYIYLFFGVLLSLSYSLSQKNPNSVKDKVRKKPILYLRSFGDDGETTFNRNSVLSTFLGVDPPYYLVEQLEIGKRTWISRILKQGIRLLYRFHPLFLIRLMFGNPKETSEQQLGNLLKRHGFFVAIGKPGEKFVTTGASRVYVTNEEWQQTVLDVMKDSSFVVLQPSRSQGILWEVNQVFAKLAPGNILLSMINYNGFQNDYEVFRQKLHDLFPERPMLPRSLGNDPDIVFLSFNENWEPQEIKLKHYWWTSWPFRGTTANLHETLAPFVQTIPTTGNNSFEVKEKSTVTDV